MSDNIEQLKKHSQMLGRIATYVEDFAESEEDTTLICVLRLLARYHQMESGCDLVEDDWEGMSPHPILKTSGCRIIYPINELSEGRARFVRRKSWEDFEKYEKSHAPFELSIEDILANDWEVWE